MKFSVVAGARPNFVKIAPILNAIDAYNSSNQNKIVAQLVHTGQHYDIKMSKCFFDDLGIRTPDENLEVGSASHAVMTARVMLGFEEYCLREKPDRIIVVGDVNSTLACALVGVKLGVPVDHVEGGLRSFDRSMPEEINRILTDSIADLIFTHSPEAETNLIQEGIPKERIRYVGNVMIDTLVGCLDRLDSKRARLEIDLVPGEFVYTTLHRPSNVDSKEKLSRFMSFLGRLSTKFQVVFPLHPRTARALNELSIEVPKSDNLYMLEPVSYLQSLRLARDARLVISDSGGIQEETTYFQTPCLTLRDNTERPITISKGSNKLTRLEDVESDVEDVLAREARFGEVPPLWDGSASDRIIAELAAC